MVFFKLLLNDKRPKTDNIYPVVVRVTYNRKNTTFNTGIRVKKDNWDKNSCKVKHSDKNAQSLNKTISDYFAKVQKAALRLVDDGNFSFDTLKNVLENKAKPAKAVMQESTFKEFAERLISDLLAINKAGNAIIYRTATNKLLAYAIEPKLKFIDINYSLLEGFKNQLIKDGLKPNSISNYFRTLRAIYNKAIKAKLIDRSHYPFLDVTVKTERTAKRAITIMDMQRIYQTSYKPNTGKWNARNYFLLSFCLRGLSFTDLAYLTNDNVKNGRIIYKRRKTRSQLNIRLEVLANEIIQEYIGRNNKYLMPVLPENIVEDSLNSKAIIYQWIKTTNKWLRRIATDCSIESDITTYVTRHSWATISKSLGYSNELIAEGLGHEYGNKITNIYLDSFDQSVIDEANERIIKIITDL